ncbi:hypothetical protein AB0F91_34695 [Amycolatopsis sp. NPDC023774]
MRDFGRTIQLHRFSQLRPQHQHAAALLGAAEDARRDLVTALTSLGVQRS